MSIQSHPSQTSDATHRKLGNFFSTYTLLKSDELLCRSLTVMIGGNYAGLSNFSKERLLDYFEALEEVLPALYELQEKLTGPQNQEGEENTFPDKVSENHIYASFKRHPE